MITLANVFWIKEDENKRSRLAKKVYNILGEAKIEWLTSLFAKLHLRRYDDRHTLTKAFCLELRFNQSSPVYHLLSHLTLPSAIVLT